MTVDTVREYLSHFQTTVVFALTPVVLAISQRFDAVSTDGGSRDTTDG